MKTQTMLMLLIIPCQIFIAGCTSNVDSEELEKTLQEKNPESNVEVKETIRYQTINLEENGTFYSFKLDKVESTYDFEMEMPWNFSEDDALFFEETGMKNFTLTFMCGIMQLAFYNESGMEEFTDSWNNATFVNSSDEGSSSDEVEDTIISSILEDYDADDVAINLVDVNTEEVVGGCDIVGPNPDDLEIKIFE